MRRILTKMEFEVMSVLWEGEGPMSSTDIIMAAPIEFKQSTVQAVLRTLLKEGWIQIGGVSIHTKSAGARICAGHHERGIRAVDAGEKERIFHGVASD